MCTYCKLKRSCLTNSKTFVPYEKRTKISPGTLAVKCVRANTGSIRHDPRPRSRVQTPCRNETPPFVDTVEHSSQNCFPESFRQHHSVGSDDIVWPDGRGSRRNGTGRLGHVLHPPPRGCFRPRNTWGQQQSGRRYNVLDRVWIFATKGLCPAADRPDCSELCSAPNCKVKC